MTWRPTNPESLNLLRQVRREIAECGDGRLALLLEIMRSFAHDMHLVVEGTPTVRELEQLFERDPPS